MLFQQELEQHVREINDCLKFSFISVFSHTDSEQTLINVFQSTANNMCTCYNAIFSLTP